MLKIKENETKKDDSNNEKKLDQHRKGVRGNQKYNESLPSCEFQVKN